MSDNRSGKSPKRLSETEFSHGRIRLASNRKKRRKLSFARPIILVAIALAVLGSVFLARYMNEDAESKSTGNCRIKGNISSSGEKIYHMPGTQSYESTKINLRKGERWFCSEHEALQAGWRAPKF